MIGYSYVTREMASARDPPELLAFGTTCGIAELRERAAGRNVLAVLTESTADEWHRTWERARAEAEQLALVECYELARSTTASRVQTRVVSDDLAISTVPRPVETKQLSAVLTRFLDGWETGESDTLIYIESLDDLVTDAGRTELHRLFERLVERTRTTGSGIIVAADPETDDARTVVAFEALLAETVGAPDPTAEATAAVRRLREADPTKFGYFRQYWREAVHALERVDRAYPQANQLHESVESEGLSPRMLGTALSALAWLDAISLRGNTNGANRYDRQSYDPEYAARLGLAVDALDEE
jgi:hypothetical protein